VKDGVLKVTLTGLADSQQSSKTIWNHYASGKY